MNKFVLDTSALLVVLHQEVGIDQLPPLPELIANAMMGTMNLAEAQSKLVDNGIPPEEAWEAIHAAVHEFVVFDEVQAKLTGDLISQTRSLGLSLGDRACLALAITLNAPVYKVDRQWAMLDLGIPIHVIR